MLFSPFSVRGLTLGNRIVVSPMCQYSCEDGLLNDWHFVHLGSRAVGGAALVIVEASGVEPRGRISPDDAGIYDDRHIEPLAWIGRFVRGQGSLLGLQIAHAGRKASTHAPWRGKGAVRPAQGGWQPVGPGAEPFDAGYPVPRALDTTELPGIVASFREAARRARDAKVDVLEVHAAHGYLLHSFLSPLTNRRGDRYGGDLAGRSRLLFEVIESVRGVWPDRAPLFVRVSAQDWVEGGLTVDEVVEVARGLRERGVDVIDVSSGGASPAQKIELAAGYQVPFAERVRREAGIATMAVGLITGARQADAIVRDGKADLVALARELLRDPYWPQRAAKELGVAPPVPPQYSRAH